MRLDEKQYADARIYENQWIAFGCWIVDEQQMNNSDCADRCKWIRLFVRTYQRTVHIAKCNIKMDPSAYSFDARQP